MAITVAERWRCEAIKTEDFNRVDWVLNARAGRVTRALMECKNRAGYTWSRLDALGGVLISESKWRAAQAQAQDIDVPFVYVVQVNGDELWYHHTRDADQHDGIKLAGRTDHGDPRDVEPCVHLLSSRFRAVRSSKYPPAPKDITEDLFNWSFYNAR